ncbi:MAG: hypothetical protein ACRD21_18245 [Vicinamibacteria bacterium]
MPADTKVVTCFLLNGNAARGRNGARERAPLYAVAATDKLTRLETPGVEPLFEVTPRELVSGIATERGLVRPDAVPGLLPEIEARSDWRT